MSTAIWLVIFTNIFLITFIITLIKGLIDHSKKLLMISGILFVGTGVCGSIAVYMLMNKSFSFIENIFEPRTGEEIYSASFGNSVHNCTTIINNVDYMGASPNCCIWLQFQTCPAELERILIQRDYTLTRTNKEGVELESPQIKSRPGWWSPRILGDSILVFKTPYSESSREQWLFSSLDSTMVFYYEEYFHYK